VVLLSAMTDAVAALVLEDNRLQALGLSIAESGGAEAMPGHVRLIEMLEDRPARPPHRRSGRWRCLRPPRGRKRRGLTRPELAVLLSSASWRFRMRWKAPPWSMTRRWTTTCSRLPRGDARDLRGHPGHRLRREILATRLANRLINRLGFVHPFELAEEEGVGAAEVTAAFLAAEKLFDLEAIWQAIEDAPIAETPASC
jgi:glutamate dehydrogenase